ncbi:MAG TPA: Trm112 family protein [Candidatus Polarisedimenticolaceae bacterium]
MSVDSRLLEILVCPACHAKVRPTEGSAGLACEGCGRVYPIRDGIPVMLVEEASAPTRR